LFILGVAVSITPLLVSAQLIRRDVPVMIGVSLLLFVMALDGKISQREGALLLLGGIGYTAWSIWQSRRENQKLKDQFVQEFSYSPLTGARQTVIQIGYVLVGVGLLVLGSNWLVNGAVSIAEYLGVSQLIIGLTIVAAGTSLPEVATSVVASLRGQRDIAVGNVVGSNIFNILSVVGLAAFVSPQGLNVSHAALAFDLPVMVAVAIACLPIFFTGGVIARWEGALFLTYYLVYMFYLLLSATHSQILPVYTTSMLIFVLPVTVMTIGISLARALRAKAG
jgi:cation:H+ antiporter